MHEVSSKDGECTVPGAKITFDTKERTSMYCFTVYTKDTGSTKKSKDLEILMKQTEKRSAFLLAIRQQLW